MNFKLVGPTISMEQNYLDYIVEWENRGEKIVPYPSRREGMDYRDLLARWMEEATEKAYENGFVPATILFMTDEIGKIYGSIHIRHTLNDNLLKHGGHIGYGIRPSERNKGYAAKMLSMALPIAKELGMKDALLTCDKANFASARTILANGGILEDEVIDGDRITQRYWIKLDDNDNV